jgi:hypothetical protein
MPKVNFRYLHSKAFFFFFLFVAVLISSCFSPIFDSGVSPFASGASDKVVSTETELRNAINNSAGSTIITLNKDITLTETTLTIPAGKDITLTSNSNTKLFKLIGRHYATTLTVENDGVLKIDGIIVTHELNDSMKRTRGIGVYVNSSGTLALYSGEISGNKASSDGGSGVYNTGSFSMFGGAITNNTTVNEDEWYVLSGGGVYNSGSFTMSGGTISGNTASNYGGGVYNSGNFTMSGGTITNNTSLSLGGGVCNRGNFTIFDGMISNNTVTYGGGGVYTGGDKFAGVTFEMFDGMISDNTAMSGGAVAMGIWGSFSMFGGEITNNKANYGGGIILSNVLYEHGDVKDVAKLIGGTISGNIAYTDGGGVYVGVKNLDTLFVLDGVMFENNCASATYDRSFIHNRVYDSHIGRNVTWTAPFTQGYNNYDISYTGAQIPYDVISRLVIVAVLAVGAIGWLFLYFKKRKTDAEINHRSDKSVAPTLS